MSRLRSLDDSCTRSSANVNLQKPNLESKGITITPSVKRLAVRYLGRAHLRSYPGAEFSSTTYSNLLDPYIVSDE